MGTIEKCRTIEMKKRDRKTVTVYALSNHDAS